MPGGVLREPEEPQGPFGHVRFSDTAKNGDDGRLSTADEKDRLF